MIDISNSELNILIDEYIHSKRDRAILKMRLIDGVCYDQLSFIFNLSSRQIKNIVYRNEEKLFKKLSKKC